MSATVARLGLPRPPSSPPGGGDGGGGGGTRTWRAEGGWYCGERDGCPPGAPCGGVPACEGGLPCPGSGVWPCPGEEPRQSGCPPPGMSLPCCPVIHTPNSAETRPAHFAHPSTGSGCPWNEQILSRDSWFSVMPARSLDGLVNQNVPLVPLRPSWTEHPAGCGRDTRTWISLALPN